MLLQWQYAPNNNGRVKKSRLKKEAEAAAAQPESCKATESQQSPTKPVCIPLNAHADRHLLKWPPSIAPRSRQTTASAEAKEAVGSRKSAHAEEQAAELQQPALHKTSVGEDAHAEAQADVGTIAQTVAWSKQRSSGCTEHRKLLSQGLLDLTESIRTSPDARDGAAVQQSSPEPKSKAVCHSAQPDQPLQHSLHSPEQQSYSLIGPVTQPDQSRQSSPAKQQSPVRSSPDRSAGQEDFSLTAISHTRSPTEPVTGMPAISERNASPTASEDATLPASSLVAADASNRQLAASDRVALHEASPGTGRKATTAAQDVTLGSHSAEPEASDAAATNAQPLSSCAAATISAPAAAPAAEQTVSPQAKPALTRLPSGAAELSRAGVDPCSPQSVLLLEKATRAKLTQTSASVPSGVNEIVHASSDMQAQRSRHMLNLTPEQLALLADRALIGASLLAKDALNIPENHDSTAIHLQSVQGRQQTDTTAMPLPVNRSPVHNDTRI